MRTKNILIPIEDVHLTALEEYARSEFRAPWQQAVVIIISELERRGLIKPAVVGVVDEQRAAGAAGNSNILKQGAKDMSNLQQVDVQGVGGVSDPPPAEEATDDVDVSAGEEIKGVNIDDRSPLEVLGDDVETSTTPNFFWVGRYKDQKASVKPFESR